ncbi:MAG: O-antigen ligase family protein [Acidobacteriota bacterium]|nr:O-antigen ligase family protein [Acidobacteriota bacterium]
MPSVRILTTVERVCLITLLAWLVWLPLPFGSVIPRARLPLIALPLLVCAIAAAARLLGTRERTSTARTTRAWMIWAGGAALLIVLGALQLVPLSPGLLRALSPESEAIWTAASRMAKLAGVSTSGAHPISLDPRATAFEVFRIASLVAAFTSAAFLFRTHTRRVALASVLCITAMFESVYGLRAAALQRYEIWGWVNRLIFNRVTGTFVNPNHFGHYLAIVLPMALFLAAYAWHVSGTDETPLARRLAMLIERRVLMTGFALIAIIACVSGILLAQSRGALLALLSGSFLVAALLPGRRLARVALAGTGGIALVLALVVYLGTERTVARFVPSQLEQQTLVGRRIGISAAFSLWQRFSIFGSGLGTFEHLVSMEQKQDLERIYHHAHNDYAELAATGGALGFVIVMVALAGGYVELLRMTFGKVAELTWRRRAFQAAALASMTIAMVHALFDFNFFIPSNPATLAVIMGAAVASIDHDKRTRR